MTVTREQHMEALSRANEVRYSRAALKLRIKAGRTSAADVLSEEIPEWAAGMRLHELLKAEPRIGPKRMARMTQEASVVPFGINSRLSQLSGRQKAVLVSLLREKADRSAKKRARTKFERGVR